MRYQEPVPQEFRMPALLEGMTGEIVPDIKVRGLALDSRDVIEGALFLACRGKRQHGLDFWQQAQANGAAALAWEPCDDIEPPNGDIPSVAVSNLSFQAAEIAARFYGHPSRELFVVGITGTDGKTSCAWLLAQACQHLGQECGYLGTLGYGLPGLLEDASHTTPDPVRLQYWLARLRASGAEAVAMEVSSHALDQGRAEGVNFDVALLTNLGRDHLDYHGDLQSYAAAKRRLFDSSGLSHAVLNGDDVTGRAWLADLHNDVEGIAFGFSDDLPELGVPYVQGSNVHCTIQGIELDIHSSWGDGRLSSPLLGQFNAANLLACLSVLLARGEVLEEAISSLDGAGSVPGRMEVVSSRSGDESTLIEQPLVVVDYAHTPQALRQALLAVRAHASGRVICVFGCGGDRDAGKRPLMGQAAVELADEVIITDDNPRSEKPADIVAGIVSDLTGNNHYRIEHNRALAIEQAIESADSGDVVLIAGKGHEDYQIVGNARLSFDDRQVAGAALARGTDNGGTH